MYGAGTAAANVWWLGLPGGSASAACCQNCRRTWVIRL